MSRWLIAAVVASTCSTAFADWPISKPVPTHGYAVGAGGLNGYSTIVIDYDAKTLHYQSEPFFSDAKKIDQMFHLSQAVVDKLHGFASAAQTEKPHGEMPHVTDVGETFIAIDGSHRVEISGTLFDAIEDGTPAWHPLAGRVVNETYATAKSLGVKE